jgi:2-phosphosulfolactate phosphatase
MMKFHRTTLETCHSATGFVIVIDVLRAFSTAAHAFSRGAKEIVLVSRVEDALNLKAQIPNSKVMGEVNGLRPQRFDFGNSPTQISTRDLTDLILIQRTGAGTQGAVRCVNAETMLAASFVVASATVRNVGKLSPDKVTFVITGGEDNDEDIACADYLEELLIDKRPNPEPYIRRVFESNDGMLILDPDQSWFPESDLQFCTDLDKFDFAMPIQRVNERLIMRRNN